MMVMFVMMMMMMVMMVMVMMVVRFRRCAFGRLILCPGSDRGKADSRGEQHRRENFLHHIFLLRDAFGPQLGRETINRICEFI
jgi:hypothetical protein